MNNSKFLVFISSPFGDDSIVRHINTERAKRYCAMVFRDGGIPIAPHLYFPTFLNEQFMLEAKNYREDGILSGIELLAMCDMMYAFGEPTEGMLREIEFAEAHDIPIQRFTVEGKDVINYEESEVK